MIVKGDKVRFLNDIGGGVVARVVGDTVYVEDQDGFEIPAKMGQVVLVDKKEKKKEAPSPAAIGKPALGETKVVQQGEEPMVYLALLQGDKSGSLSGDFRLHMVNDSQLSVVYFIYRSARVDGQFDLMYKGEVTSGSVCFVDKIPGRMLDEKSLIVQLVMFNPSGAFVPVKPISKEIKIKSVRLLREGSFAKNRYFAESALLYELMPSVMGNKIELLKEHLSAEKSTVAKPISQVAKKPKSGDIIEIDLHIHELIEDVRGLSNGEMLKIQLDKFRQTIDSYKSIKGLKLVFIHGVGNGTLKQEVIRSLKSDYKSLYYQDASFKEYGYGATLVII